MLFGIFCMCKLLIQSRCFKELAKQNGAALVRALYALARIAEWQNQSGKVRVVVTN